MFYDISIKVKSEEFLNGFETGSNGFALPRINNIPASKTGSLQNRFVDSKPHSGFVSFRYKVKL